jgi:hypothetical protein
MEIDKIEYYFKVLARYDQYIQLANTKASNHITLLASMLVAITALVGWGFDKNELGLMMALVGFLYLLFLFACYEWYSSCMKVIRPNRSRNDGNTSHRSESELSTIFYSDVAKFTCFQSFKNQVDSKNDSDQINDLIHQVFIMAKVTEKKFDDYENVHSKVVASVILSVLILFFVVLIKM